MLHHVTRDTGRGNENKQTRRLQAENNHARLIIQQCPVHTWQLLLDSPGQCRIQHMEGLGKKKKEQFSIVSHSSCPVLDVGALRRWPYLGHTHDLKRAKLVTRTFRLPGLWISVCPPPARRGYFDLLNLISLVIHFNVPGSVKCHPNPNPNQMSLGPDFHQTRETHRSEFNRLHCIPVRTVAAALHHRQSIPIFHTISPVGRACMHE